jgi:hypothetical protein
VRLGKSSNALTNGTSDLAHGLSISSRKRFCSTSLSRSFGSISQPLVLSALDSEASEAASWSSVVSILVGCEVGQVLGRTLGARRWCACACLRAGAGVRAPGGGAGISCGLARACRMSLAHGLTRRPEMIAKKVEKLREAKVTTLRRVLLARSCAMEGEDVV